MSETLVDELVAKLEGAIFRGEFPPGTRIREARVANSLGVGRGPVREAVRRLEGRKLVVRRPNRGTSITTLTKAELAELLEVREALEVAACRLAAKNITDEAIEKLRRTLVRQKDATADKFSEMYSEWHNLLRLSLSDCPRQRKSPLDRPAIRRHMVPDAPLSIPGRAQPRAHPARTGRP
jgi:DNA-binding GntR family transcriptional regulator